MLRTTIPVSALSLNPPMMQKMKFKFSYEKTKEWLSNQFLMHDAKVQADKILNPAKENRKMVNFPQSVIDTAFAISKLFISEFQKGKVKGKTTRFTYSYLKKSLVGAKLSTRTLERHIRRLLDDLSFPFLASKNRSTLGETGHFVENNTVCIALEISPSAVKCVDNSQVQLWEQGQKVQYAENNPQNSQIIFGTDVGESIKNNFEQSSEPDLELSEVEMFEKSLKSSENGKFNPFCS